MRAQAGFGLRAMRRALGSPSCFAGDGRSGVQTNSGLGESDHENAPDEKTRIQVCVFDEREE